MQKYEFGVTQLLGNYFITYRDNDYISCSYPVTIEFMQKHFKKDSDYLKKVFAIEQVFIYNDEKIAEDKVKKIQALEFLNKIYDF